MANHAIRNILYVFLASPSDLAEERRLARDVVDELNRVCARRLKWSIELLGWEDTLPGFVRPQEKINADVRLCRLFIGMLWRRWGQPTGKYSSGFEEEFELAKRLRSEAQAPEIWLYFRRIEPAQGEDPGPQLEKVLEFKRNIEMSKECLFGEFADPEEWRKKLHDNLLQYLMDLALSALGAHSGHRER